MCVCVYICIAWSVYGVRRQLVEVEVGSLLVPCGSEGPNSGQWNNCHYSLSPFISPRQHMFFKNTCNVYMNVVQWWGTYLGWTKTWVHNKSHYSKHLRATGTHVEVREQIYEVSSLLQPSRDWAQGTRLVQISLFPVQPSHWSGKQTLSVLTTRMKENARVGLRQRQRQQWSENMPGDYSYLF